MARTGKKSVKSKPALMKKQITSNRRIQKKSNAKDRNLQDLLDKELTSEDIFLKKKSPAKAHQTESAKIQTDELLASFEQLRGM